MATTSTSVGFVGLGHMGGNMAARFLAAGYPVYGEAQSRENAQDLIDQGLQWRDTPREVAQEADVLFTSLPDDGVLEQVASEPDGILAGLTPGKTWVDMSTVSPHASREVAARVREAGASMLDAPVSGSVPQVQSGTLTIMVGGDAAVLERARPVLETFGQKIVHCGEVGAGDAVKAVNNAFLATHILAAAEGLAALVKMGVDPKVALDVINASSGRSNASMNLIPERVITRKFPRTFRLALLEKDVGIAAEVARETRVPAPILQLTADLFRIARGEFGEVADHVEAVKMVEQWAGVEIA